MACGTPTTVQKRKDLVLTVLADLALSSFENLIPFQQRIFQNSKD